MCHRDAESQREVKTNSAPLFGEIVTEVSRYSVIVREFGCFSRTGVAIPHDTVIEFF